MQGIYKITNNLNGSIYIGKSNNLERRWKDHQRLAFTPDQKQYNKVLYRAMRKYGLNNFSFEIIELLQDYSISGQREKYWIQYFDSYKSGYNQNEGGDGGSLKGHCQGQSNGRAKLTTEDVINIRKDYATGLSRQESYQKYKDKISESGFGRVWNGKTWTHIMPEVFTQENKQKTVKKGKAVGGKKHRIYTDEQVKIIRLAKKQGMKRSEAIKKFMKKGSSKSSFEDLWYNKTYKEIQV